MQLIIRNNDLDKSKNVDSDVKQLDFFSVQNAIINILTGKYIPMGMLLFSLGMLILKIQFFPSKYTRRTREIKVVIHAYVYKNYTLDLGILLQHKSCKNSAPYPNGEHSSASSKWYILYIYMYLKPTEGKRYEPKYY